MDENPVVSLDTLMGGEIIDRFKYEFQRVIENIADPNTTLTKRGVTIKLEVKPNKSRTQSDVTVSFATKLAPTEAMDTTVFISMTKKGLVVSEYNPKQPTLPEVLAASGATVTSLRVAGGVA
ncbi:hypothetical protein UFOVP1419_14 [uncultured Caudovirales phage]|uniref:Phage protein n=1 Tax=uncultured Caudovirales phage TaxID=2100421 RepID=A0A6J5SD31_9CAUD|nr:hypothetical protein UFOVP1419_14 [uncultured Caudovirales phage]